MPNVTATPRSLRNGEVITEFTDTTSTTAVSYTYPLQQAGISIENSGVSDIFITVGGYTNQVVNPNKKWKADTAFSSFSIRSDVNSQEFTATAFQNDVEGSGEADIIARGMLNQLSGLVIPQGNAGSVVIHSDDGRIENKREFYEIWKPLNIPFCIAIVKSFVGTAGYLTENDIKQMHRDGCEIMSHTVSHIDMATLTLAQARTEFADSKTYLENLIGEKVSTFVYPFNSRNDATDQIGLQYYEGLRGSGTGVPRTVLPGQSLSRVHDYSVQLDFLDFQKNPPLSFSNYRKIFALAASGLSSVLYYHYTTDNAAELTRSSFEALKEGALTLRKLGFKFVRSSDIYTKNAFGLSTIANNNDINRWEKSTPGTSSITIDSINGWGADKALKFSNPTAGNSDKPYLTSTIPVRPMTLYCFSRREHIVTPMTSGRGIALAVIPIYKDLGQAATHFPLLNDDMYKTKSDPQQYLARTADDGVLKTYYLTPPDCYELGVRVMGYNITSDVWVSNLSFEALKTFDTISGEVTLNGTTGRDVLTGWVETQKYEVLLTPRSSYVGNLYVVKGSKKFTIFSTDATDTTQLVGWTIVPKESVSLTGHTV